MVRYQLDIFTIYYLCQSNSRLQVQLIQGLLINNNYLSFQFSCQSILMVCPKHFQEIFKRNSLRVIIQLNNFCVVTTENKIHNCINKIFISIKFQVKGFILICRQVGLLVTLTSKPKMLCLILIEGKYVWQSSRG